MKHEEEHSFTVTVDIVKMDQDSDRVVINGFLGEELDIQLSEDGLELVGNEASITVAMNPEKIKRLMEAQ
jgi:hypothetical protein